jgi:hypothetical protein
MPDKEYTIQDMIGAAASESPSDFQNAFSSAILDRIAQVVDNKKQELAQTYFNTDAEQSQEEEPASVDDASSDTEDTNEEETDENTETAAGV